MVSDPVGRLMLVASDDLELLFWENGWLWGNGWLHLYQSELFLNICNKNLSNKQYLSNYFSLSRKLEGRQVQGSCSAP